MCKTRETADPPRGLDINTCCLWRSAVQQADVREKTYLRDAQEDVGPKFLARGAILAGYGNRTKVRFGKDAQRIRGSRRARESEFIDSRANSGLI
jgi:hypothetical protein